MTDTPETAPEVTQDPKLFHVSRSSDGEKHWFSAYSPSAGVSIPAKSRDDAYALVSSINRAILLYHRTTPEAARQDVREALGRFGHHPDPGTDFEHEVECCENDAYDLRGEIGILNRGALMLRIERAMSFRVGGDAGCVRAKRGLRALEQALKEGREREYIDGVIAARAALSTSPLANETGALREGLPYYDAGLLGDGGGGDVDWWQDYLRAELARAHEFYADHFAALASPDDGEGK